MKKSTLFMSFILIGALVISSCKKKGCTDVTASNYNSEAKKDDGSCIYYVTDIDGNNYPYKLICNQIWTTENLYTKKYKNGDPIPQVQDASTWENLTTGAWCYYNNDPSKGVLYNWHAVADPRGLAPEGWHVPLDYDYTTLLDCQGGSSNAKKLKYITGWTNNNGTNESGFSALPRGFRANLGFYDEFGVNGWWWTSSLNPSSNSTSAKVFYITDVSDNPAIGSCGNKMFGFSVRILRD